MQVSDREVGEMALNTAIDNNALIIALIQELHKVGVKVDMDVIKENAESIAEPIKQKIQNEVIK